MDFYEAIAGQYDDMTRFKQRLQSEKAVLQRWVERYGFYSAIDAACGTGLHAVLLAQMGIQVVGTDLSSSMLAEAKKHADEAGVEVTWVPAPMQELGQHIRGRFDSVFCLGNSLPHLLTQADLLATLEAFHALLNPFGVLVIQLLNYDRILTTQERIVGVHRQGSREYVRFYDFLPGEIRFNVLTIDWADEKAAHSLHSTLLHPYRQDELMQALAHCGFVDFDCFGDMQFSPFDKTSSQNLIIVGKKTN